MIARADPEQILGNIYCVTALSFEHQCDIATASAQVLARREKGEFRLIIIDCIMSHLRAEFAGRGELAARQQALHAHLHQLKRLADAFNCAIVVTNQVTTNPDSTYMGSASIKACGGPIMAHNAKMRIQLKKGRAQLKKASLEHSSFMPKGACFLSHVAQRVYQRLLR